MRIWILSNNAVAGLYKRTQINYFMLRNYYIKVQMLAFETSELLVDNYIPDFPRLIISAFVKLFLTVCPLRGTIFS